MNCHIVSEMAPWYVKKSPVIPLGKITCDANSICPLVVNSDL
jgi:hypothetical protein